MHDGVIKIKHDAGKLVFGLEKQHHKHISLSLSNYHFPIGQLINLHKEPHSKKVDDYVHLLAEVPCDIPPGDQVDESVNVDGSTRVRDRADITQQLGVIGAIRIIQIVIRLLNIRL